MSSPSSSSKRRSIQRTTPGSAPRSKRCWRRARQAPDEALPLQTNLGKQYYNAKQYDRAGTEFERVLELDPNNPDALAMLAETRKAQGRVPEAVAMLQKGIAARVAAGQKATRGLV